MRIPVLLGAAGLAVATVLTTPALAGTGSANGPEGQTLTVSETTGLPAGDATTVTVTGHGFDTGKGIYVAFCKDNGPGEAPSPCGGGADTTGSTGASHWISDDPPPYGKDLAEKYGPDGSFEVTLSITGELNDEVDCAATRCVVATRADHTRGQDRTQDVRVPIAFDEGGVPAVAWAGGAAAAVAVVAAGGALALRRRGRRNAAAEQAP
ncbi:hypothetical protein [Actinomadura algeriensis]|uniref:Neocarzinostatin family protein n=1 Tax=Actinomadura algeriensis TaxID=1679523 RepID=A0ABR9JRN0_9ACTN|nr:hypothetical protein [Actinomadura algeriensis]MBE1533069.1 hypothetical protein [Actinomadura algeriensis]